MLVHWSIVKSLQNHFDKVHLLIERPLSRNLTAKRDWLPSGTKNLRLSYSYLTNLIIISNTLSGLHLHLLLKRKGNKLIWFDSLENPFCPNDD